MIIKLPPGIRLGGNGGAGGAPLVAPAALPVQPQQQFQVVTDVRALYLACHLDVHPQLPFCECTHAQVQCPPGVGPGANITVQTPSGQAVQVQVPSGVPPGGTFIAAVASPAAIAPLPTTSRFAGNPMHMQ